MKPIAPSWIIEDLGRLRRGRAERERAGAELPLPPPPSKDRREEQPVGGTVIVIEPWSPEPDGGEAIAVNQLKPPRMPRGRLGGAAGEHPIGAASEKVEQRVQS